MSVYERRAFERLLIAHYIYMCVCWRIEYGLQQLYAKYTARCLRCNKVEVALAPTRTTLSLSPHISPNRWRIKRKLRKLFITILCVLLIIVYC